MVNKRLGFISLEKCKTLQVFCLKITDKLIDPTSSIGITPTFIF